MPISPEAVWLFCGVIVGVRVASSSALVANSGADGDWFEQLRSAATTAAARACDRRIMDGLREGAKKRRGCTNVNLRPSSWRSFARALPVRRAAPSSSNAMEHLEPLEHRRVLSRDPPNAEAAEGAFAHLLTPAAMRFVRCNFPVPRLDEAHQLEIAGEVSQAGRLPLAHLKTLPSVTLTVVTECAGNGRARIEPPVDGDPWRNGAVSVAQWTGVPLRSVLALKDTAVEVVFTGADGGAYQRSLPREIAMDPATLVAWEMNGTPIPARFGGPLRLVVPGWYGM